MGRRSGFSLIELMIAVAIIGIMASVGMTTFGQYIMKSRSGEAMNGLGMLFRGQAAYWHRGASGKGIDEGGADHCLVLEPGHTLHPPPPITDEKKFYDFTTQPDFAALGFSRAEPGYYHYTWGVVAGDDRTIANQCGLPPGYTGWVAAYMAAADLDGDGLIGGYHMGIAVDANRDLSRSIGWGPVWPAEFGDASMFCPTCVPYVD